MDIEFWGVRGTMPVSGKDRLKYGGRTPCASVISEAGDIVIVDAGTGIKTLGERLIARPAGERLRLHVLLTHFHLDHVVGLPFFAPLYSASAHITFYSELLPRETEKQLRGVMSGRYFPVDFRETASTKTYVRVGEDTISIGKFKISGCPLNHPQGSLGYRLSEGDGSIAFATDTEPPEDGLDERLARFIQGAVFFVCDATFTPEEYKSRQGWGHGTWLDGTRLARRAGVENLLLSHLNPEHDDAQVDGMVRLARREFARVSAAREGLRLTTPAEHERLRKDKRR
jgi:phosphoribosyl 1,2-cyclic phosphodiesterase